MVRFPGLTRAEYQVLAAYATAHGKSWKVKLRADWAEQRTEGVLKSLYDVRGAAWLERFNLNRAAASLSRRDTIRRQASLEASDPAIAAWQAHHDHEMDT